MKNYIWIFVLGLLVFSSIAHGKVLEVFYCNGGKVDIGDTSYSVLKKCGTPAFQEIISAEGCDKVERWHYDCKGRGYVDLLEFKVGILTNRSRGEKSQGVQDCR
ncbi:MAG: DUF2845 domain-containing protein [Proteobacteria bacterium]|nr:DUF2845 domain-containing protein [Pseudomonadota bacterium]MBU1687887.1 DUF2845 domain-containing protein [Pseudomonadota bacterium]